MTTHTTSEKSIKDTLDVLKRDRNVLKKPFILRIANMGQSLS
jgi:hypothetical protein